MALIREWKRAQRARDSSRPQRVVLLGATGSIGCSALEVMEEHPELFEPYALIANRSVKELHAQIEKHRPAFAGLMNGAALKELSAQLSNTSENPQLLGAEDEVLDLLSRDEVDTVVVAVVGMVGLKFVIAALQAGKRVALANKESIVAGGKFMQDSLSCGGQIVPVDSEHAALLQALLGSRREEVKSITLTASGGPFLNTPREKFKDLSLAEALRHPRWEMGPKNTIDSATMVNKGLELIEAHWLFGFEEQEIGVVVHPQSIVHSLVEFVDGAQLAQLSVPDMKGPISFALNYPNGRVPQVMAPLVLQDGLSLEFLRLDDEKFPAVQLARECIAAGQEASFVFNLANEVAVEGFVSGVVPFSGIVPFIETALERYSSLVFSDITEMYNCAELVGEELRAGVELEKVG